MAIDYASVFLNHIEEIDADIKISIYHIICIISHHTKNYIYIMANFLFYSNNTFILVYPKKAPANVDKVIKADKIDDKISIMEIIENNSSSLKGIIMLHIIQISSIYKNLSLITILIWAIQIPITEHKQINVVIIVYNIEKQQDLMENTIYLLEIEVFKIDYVVEVHIVDN